MPTDRKRDARSSEDPERHARIKELFFQAIELSEDDRSRFLDEACGGDAELRSGIEALLGHHRRSDLPDDWDDREC